MAPIEIELWTAANGRWSELLALVETMGQTRWATDTYPWHLTAHMLVARQAEALVGFLRYVRQPIGPDDDCPAVVVAGEELVEAKVMAFAVVAAQRRQGIGDALQRALVADARRRGCYQIRSHSGGANGANHALKLSLGFGVHPIIRGDDERGAYFILPLTVDEPLTR